MKIGTKHKSSVVLQSGQAFSCANTIMHVSHRRAMSGNVAAQRGDARLLFGG